ncbi:MAG TPA: hypothetical protein VK776_03775 [Bryobacteraceae bacterium]|jgi:arginine exporter protein ArgO|nr:hypothetical protein [Bryobacteraceae bacterium]
MLERLTNGKGPQFRQRLTRLFSFCSGLVLITVGLIGCNTTGEQLPLLRRAVVIAGGTFFLYCGLSYYLPKHRKKREELHQQFDELEAELDDLEGKSK